LSEMIIDPIDQ